MASAFPLFQRLGNSTWTTVAAPQSLSSAASRISLSATASQPGADIMAAYLGAGPTLRSCLLTEHLDPVSTATITMLGSTDPPAVAAFGGTVYCVYQGAADESLHICAYDIATGAWQDDHVICLPNGDPIVKVWGAPALVVFDGQLFCLYQKVGYTGNLMCVSFNGVTWQQYGDAGGTLPASVPGMSMSPTATVLDDKIYCFYQGYGSNGANGDGTLTGCSFDGTTWTSLGKIGIGQAVTASPAAATRSGQLWVFYQTVTGSLGYVVTRAGSGLAWLVGPDFDVHLAPGQSPSAACWQATDGPWLVVEGQSIPTSPPKYPLQTALTTQQAQSLVETFMPYVFLHPDEKYFPVSVDWYLARVKLTHKKQVVLDTVATTNLAHQVVGAETSYLLPDGTDRYLAANDFRLWVVDPSTYAGEPTGANGQVQVPMYAAVIDNCAMQSHDLLYMFCYAYNGIVGYDPGGLGYHEGDWEHVIVRVNQTMDTILGMFCQAHGSDDEYTGWYLPPGQGDRTFFWQDHDDQHPMVMSACESHASYTEPGEFDIGVHGWKGQDQTGFGAVWICPPELVSLNATDWLQYSGRWGARAGMAANPPDAPAIQGWFIPRTDGPVGP